MFNGVLDEIFFVFGIGYFIGCIICVGVSVDYWDIFEMAVVFIGYFFGGGVCCDVVIFI